MEFREECRCPDGHSLMIRYEVFFVDGVNKEMRNGGAGNDVVNLDMGATFGDVCPGVWGFIIVDGDLSRDGKWAIESF